ncbi:hypothetical protein O3M35_003987 [Rhynocoris fuscipes]|uniref:Uncharacterized protein n=1 Tax=Rhynocoris fuscipes TaxID=488301 RepID=A0AAW1CMR2_9HEMI
MQWIDLRNVIIEERLTLDDENDECLFDVYKSNAVIKYLKPRMKEGGKIVDYHCCTFFPRHWFSAVFVIRTSCVILFTRLQNRFVLCLPFFFFLIGIFFVFNIFSPLQRILRITTS